MEMVTDRGEMSQEKQWRDVVIEKKALKLSWAKGITGKHVEFPQPDGKLVWGIETVIPLRFEEIKNIYSELVIKFAHEDGNEVKREQLREGIEAMKEETWISSEQSLILPKNIIRIRIIELSPQETLPKNKRTIDSKRNIWHDKHVLQKLTDQFSDQSVSGLQSLDQPTQDEISRLRREGLDSLLYDVTRRNKKITAQLVHSLEEPGVEEILVIHSHGGHDNIIGEQSGPVKPLITTIENKKYDLSEYQSEGNWIDLNDVIKKYDHERRTILVNTCYLGNDNLSNRRYKSLIFRAKGLTGGGDDPLAIFRTKPATLVSRP
ncbi:MAG: hypothetical protein ACD_61C00223G0007 [uncultured bacterium]|nr:MAG: hypothetical protein ACD_61C00223G0007 [uncultured bacterium]